MLRDPTSMAVSRYGKHHLAGIEVEPTFEAAWAAQRSDHLADRGLDGGPIRNFPYGGVCALGEQLQRLYSLARRDKVCVVFLEDMARDPPSALKDVAAF